MHGQDSVSSEGDNGDVYKLDAASVMRSVIGIDAAWTQRRPSGVALVVEQKDGWRLTRVASSYAGFLGPAADNDVGHFDAQALVNAAEAFSGCSVTLVAADIPLSRHPIAGRRVSDNRVSSAYGARHASTHTPSTVRPGMISEQMRDGFSCLGYQLQTSPPVARGLIEVYPHPALIELAGAARRLPYKESNIRKYWPDLQAPQRRLRLLEQWSEIVRMLDERIDGVLEAFPPLVLPAPRRAMKAYEDALDAVVCAWVGICVLEGRALPFGDEVSGIWIPSPSGCYCT